MKVLDALGRIPPEVMIALGALPSGRPKEQTSQWMALAIANEVLEVLTHGTAVTQVMVVVKQARKECSLTGLRRSADFGDDQGPHPSR